MDDIKLAVTKFERFIAGTSDHIFYGILKREFKNHKYTREEWHQILKEVKNRPAK